MENNISMQIMKRLRQIIQEISRHSKQLQEKHKITLPQLICLYEISDHGPIAIGALTQIVFINNSTVTGIIDRLERRNLVQRVRISKDRRQVHVEITQAGINFLENAPTPIHHRFMEKLEKMDPRNVSLLMWSLELLVDMLAQTDPAAASPNPPRHLMESDDDMSMPSGNI